MLPSAYVVLDRLPLTPSGKLDRQALPAPDLGAAMARAYVAPRTPVEETMARAWAEVLGVERVGVHDDFFELGGHSLIAAQIVARARSAFGVELPLHGLFTAPSVALLSALVEELHGEPVDDDLEALLAEMEMKGLSAAELEALAALAALTDGDDQAERPM
jgi:acyl carrier protein